MPSWLRTLARIASGVVAAFAAMCTVMAVHDLFFGDGHTEPGVLTGLTIFFGGITALSTWATVRGLRQRPGSSDAERAAASALLALEQRVLLLAAQNAGRVTVPELALSATVPLEQAEAVLDALARRGRADVQVTEGGATVYTVRGFLSAAEKATARDPLR